MKVKIERVDCEEKSVQDNLWGSEGAILLNEVFVLINEVDQSKSFMSERVVKTEIGGDSIIVVTYDGKSRLTYTMKILGI